jgi:hypothetical protein
MQKLQKEETKKSQVKKVQVPKEESKGSKPSKAIS